MKAQIKKDLKFEIQALRTVAIASVLIFHFFEKALPGGFIGVDVFFVISGFLISSHLVERFQKDGHFRVFAFWAARMRRILPASFVTLLVTGLLVVLFSPQTYLLAWLQGLKASVLYFQNWNLASDAVDYLRATEQVSPFQHFWSLSVEEQFYLVWPLLLLVAAVAFRKVDAILKFKIVMILVLVTSFSYSIYLTAVDPATSYFSTFTRAWQFASGALLGLYTSKFSANAKGYSFLRAAGLLLIVIGCFAINSSTAFPGFAALLPTVGTAAIIAAGQHGYSGDPILRVAKLKPVQWVGEHSYSIYLWHWPILVLGPFLISQPLNLLSKLLLLAVVLGLSYLSKRFIEDPFRFGKPFTTLKPRYVIAAMLVVSLGIGGAISLYQRQLNNQIKQELKQLTAQTSVIDKNSCAGAVAIYLEGCELHGTGDLLKPSRLSLRSDRGGAFACWANAKPSEVLSCNFGPKDATRKVALIGDSHAIMLIPMMKLLADEYGWNVVTYVFPGCTMGTDPNGSEQCIKKQSYVTEQLTGNSFDSVLFTSRRQLTTERAPDRFKGLDALAEKLASKDIKFIVLQDNPLVAEDYRQCLDVLKNPVQEASKCDMPIEVAYANPDELYLKAQTIPSIITIPTQVYFCRANKCPMVAGNVITYRDRDHISATFSRSLASVLGDELNKVIGRE